MSSNRPSEQRQTTGILTKLVRVFVLQVLFISLITVLGVYVAAKIVEDVMMRTALEGEASHFWSRFAEDSNASLPDTDNLLGYLARDLDTASLPAELQPLDPGFGRVHVGENDPLVFVDQRGQHRLYLVFDEQSVSRLSFYFGVVPLSIALVVIYLSAWFAYRLSRKAVSPVVQLAEKMRDFDLDSRSLEELDLEEIAASASNEEVNVLVDALAGFTSRINAYIERERTFTRDASHELRTPLTVIHGSAEWLQNYSNLDARQSEVVGRVLRTANDMNDLVNSLLLLARGESQKLETEVVNVNELVRKLARSVTGTHNPDGRVELELSEDAQLEVTGSHQVLTMIIGNLLRNAFNYTDSGSVRVQIGSTFVTVANQGSGIADIDTSKLFEPFYRGDPGAGAQGHGIGLDIVRRLCEFCNWGIGANYTPEEGIAFTLDFAEA